MTNACIFVYFNVVYISYLHFKEIKFHYLRKLEFWSIKDRSCILPTILSADTNTELSILVDF